MEPQGLVAVGLDGFSPVRYSAGGIEGGRGRFREGSRAAACPIVGEMPFMPVDNPYAEAEAGWEDLIAAARRIQSAANRIKEGKRSIDGFEIERTLRKHKPEMMKQHLEGLRQHRREHRL